jgi:CHASE2 domain-containing sensor protein/signal transduction histidine kinase
VTRSIHSDRSIRYEWWAVLCALVLLVGGAATQQLFWRADQMLYDVFLAMWRRPAPADIVIIAIDDRSLAEIGRWPWRRAVHATLLNRLTDEGAAAVGLDLILSDADTADGASDAALAAAIEHNGRVALPITLAPADRPELQDQVPLAAFRDAVAALGFAQVRPDADGLIRRLRLRGGSSEAPVSSFALAVARIARASSGESRGGPGIGPFGHGDELLVPFAGPPGHFERVSYVDVLRGATPPGFFRDRVVLIGATAAGLVGSHATPVSGLNQAMSGVEINANAILALREGIFIRTLPTAAVAALATLLVTVLLGLLRRASARAGLLVSLGAALATLAVSAFLLHSLQVWHAPASALAGCLIVYPVWSWRRLEAAQRFLDFELAEHHREPGRYMPELVPTVASRDALQKRIDAVRAINAARRSAWRFLSDVVESLPVGVVVTDADRRVVLANRGAARLLHRPWDAIRGRDLSELLSVFQSAPAAQLLAKTNDAEDATQVEMVTADERTLLVGVGRSVGEDERVAGFILSLVDISELRAAQHARDETMRFLSHDLRAPLASIISMIDVMQEPGLEGSPIFSLSQLQNLARRALDLAEDFTRLARAEALDPKRFRPVDLRILLAQVADELEAIAASKGVAIKIISGQQPGQAYASGDADLLRRAAINLVTNAIRHSPAQSAISLHLDGEAGAWAITVTDQGTGISPEQMSQLFSRYVQFSGQERPGNGGVGLGLLIVKTVAEKHGGSVEVRSSLGEGASFMMTLPKHRGATPDQ